MPERVKILVVDDSPDQRLAVRAVLADLDESIVEAESGRDALRQLLRSDFAVVLLDVQMPALDGFETAALIRGRRRSERTPIIFLTAHGDESHAARGYSLGAVDYIQAPFDPDVLRTKVSVFVDLYRKTEAVARQAACLELHATGLRRLADASLAIHAAGSVEELLEIAATAALEVVDGDQVSIEASMPTHELGRSQGERSIAIARPRETRLGDAEIRGLRERCVGPLRLDAEELASQLAPAAAREGDARPALRGLLVVPILASDGSRSGWIELSGKREFTADDEALVVQLARIVSLAIENALFGQLQAASRAKDEFLATLSHELRTPLQAMVSWAGILRAPDLDAQTLARGLDVIERSARSQTQLIEGLLDVSRIITGKLQIDVKPVELCGLVDAALDAARPAAQAKRISLHRSGDTRPACWVLGDAQRLQQVMGNLLSNAIKFTSEGGEATVHLEIGGSEAEIRVRDTGVGLSADFLPHLFERFRQADSSSTRSHGGLGIGLAIARHLVELHGGRIRAESAGEGCGATLSITLPLHWGAQPRETVAHRTGDDEPARRDRLDGIRVVLVDDQEEARDCIALALERRGAEVVAVGSAKDALGVLDGTPRVLLSDIAMPDRDGFALIERVRALDAESGCHTPAAALSAYARPEEQSRALAAGFDLHLAKPVDEETLVRGVLLLALRSRVGR